MNAMDFMKALGDIPEELVKICFDEDIADNVKVLSEQNTSELSELTAQYQSEEMEDDTISNSTKKISSKRIHFSGYIATVAACLAIMIGLPIIISYLNPKSGITPDDSLVPTRSQGEPDDSHITVTNEKNTTHNTDISTTIVTSKTSDKTTSSTETTGTVITNSTNKGNQDVTTTEEKTEDTITVITKDTTSESNITSKTITTIQTTDIDIQTTSSTNSIKEDKFSFEHEGEGDNFVENVYVGSEIGFIITGLKDGESVTYSLSDEEVGEIVYADNTQVTVACMKEGKTILTAKSSDGQSFEITIIVMQNHVDY